jgi:hypothetical protein
MDSIFRIFAMLEVAAEEDVGRVVRSQLMFQHTEAEHAAAAAAGGGGGGGNAYVVN